MKAMNDDKLLASLDNAPSFEDAHNTLSVLKSRWKSNLLKLDTYIQNLVREDLRGDMTTPIITYKSTARKICTYGARGEILLDRAVNLGFAPQAISDIRDLLNILDIWSAKIVKIIHHKWGETPGEWPIYICDVAPAHVLAEQSRSIRELNKIVED